MSEDFSKAIDARCGASHNIKALSIFSAISTSILMLLSIPLNALIVFVLIKDRKQKRYNSLFYKLLLNIAIADLLTGLVTDPISVTAIIKEVMVANLSDMEIYFAHLSLFFTDAVALCTLTLLSIDRTIAIVSPIKHFQGVRPVAKHVLIASTWVIGFCLVLPYFDLGFIRQLMFFSSINIGVAILSLLVTIVMYKLKLKPRISAAVKTVDRNQVVLSNKNHHADETSFNEPSRIQSPSRTSEMKIGELIAENNEMDSNSTKISADTNIITSKSTEKSFKKISRISKAGKNDRAGNNLLSKKQTRDQRKATRSFFIMLCVFLASYLPTAITMIFMNTCMTCSCAAVHVMRDVSIVSILSSSVFRPLNFILTLKYLKSSVFLKLRIRKNCKKSLNIETASGLSSV